MLNPESNKIRDQRNVAAVASQWWALPGGVGDPAPCDGGLSRREALEHAMHLKSSAIVAGSMTTLA